MLDWGLYKNDSGDIIILLVFAKIGIAKEELKHG
jgi:hypothetical protein